MFTGIITDVGRIESVEARGDLRVRIACGYDMSTVDLGASIACSGVCLTVVDKGERLVRGRRLGRDAEPHRARAVGRGRPAQPRARAEGRATSSAAISSPAMSTASARSSPSSRTAIRRASPSRPGPSSRPMSPPRARSRSTASRSPSTTSRPQPGGAVRFGDQHHPHTAAQTSFDGMAAGDSVNIEIDIIARYLGRMLDARASSV